MTSQPLPGATRKVLHSLESISQPTTLSTATSAGTTVPHTPAATQRRKSIKDKTPRQVTALLSARKQATSVRKSSGASTSNRRNTGGGNDSVDIMQLLAGDTPGGLLRALSRMPDLPPATPELSNSPAPKSEDQLPPLQAEADHRPRDSILGAAAARAPSPSVTSSSQEPSSDPEINPQPQLERSRATTPRDSFFHTSIATNLGRHRTPPPPGSGLAGLTEEELRDSTDRRRRATSSGGEVAASLLGESWSQNQNRRSAELEDEEDENVEQGRRVSLATSAFASPRQKVSEFGEEDEADDEDSRRARKPRFSTVSLGSGYNGGADDSTRSGRPSLALSAISGAESVSPDFEQDVNYQLPVGNDDDDDDLGLDDAFPEPLARSEAEEKDQEQQEEEVETMFFGDGDEGGNYGLGQEIDEAYPSDLEGDSEAQQEVEFEEDEERIPWEDKGKGRAVFDEDGDDVDTGHLDESQDESDEDGPESIAAGLSKSRSASVAPLPRLPSLSALPPAPLLARAEAARKARLLAAAASSTRSINPIPSKKRKRVQRYTPKGEKVPDLPRTRQKALLQHFLGPNVKLEEGALVELEDASQEFFAQLMGDLGAFAQHAGRKKMINEQDVVLWMHRQRILNSKNRLQTHGRRLGLDRELQSVLDGILDDDELVSKGRKRGRKSGEIGRKSKRDKRDEQSDSDAEEVRYDEE